MLRSIQPFHFTKSHLTGQVSGVGSLVTLGWLSSATDSQSVIHCEPVGAENGALLSFSLTLGKGKGVWLGKEGEKPQGERERELVQIDSRLFYPIWAVCLPPQPCKTVMIHRTEKVKDSEE